MSEQDEKKPLSARLPADLVDFVERLAQKEGRSTTAQLIRMLEDARDFEDMIARARFQRDYPRAS